MTYDLDLGVVVVSDTKPWFPGSFPGFHPAFQAAVARMGENDGEGRGAILWRCGLVFAYALAGLLLWGYFQMSARLPDEPASPVEAPVGLGVEGPYGVWL
jgi:hypothetical protein